MQSKAKTVDAYLAEVPAERRDALATLRALIKKTAPQAQESMRHGMPTYELGEMFCALASQKNYMAFYCCGGEVDTHREALGKLNCGKGCIRFRHLEDLPLKTIAAILRDAKCRLSAAK